MVVTDDSWPGKGERVCILMGTFNGAHHLRQQLESLQYQTHDNWKLVVSDDGSTDKTLTILETFARSCRPGQVMIREGPRRGFVANFLSLACTPGVDADYFAFCDQDDVWHPDKLARALSRLSRLNCSRPRLYAGRTRLIAGDGRVLGLSRPPVRPPSFGNALVQSIAGANTMVFDESARQLFLAAGPDVEPASHDWWVYMLVTGVGGVVVFDHEPATDYRQHEGNLQGQNTGLRARMLRLRQLFTGRMQHWNRQHLSALMRVNACLTPNNQETLRRFAKLHRSRGLSAIQRWFVAGCRRQHFSDNIALLLAAAAGRF